MVAAYRKGTAKGILGHGQEGISPFIHKGAQIFEAVGLASSVVDQCFSGTTSRIEGADFTVLAEEMGRRHGTYPERESQRLPVLNNPGEFHWRGGDRHMWDPIAIADLQVAVRNQSEDAYWRFSKYTNSGDPRGHPPRPAAV